MKKIRSIITKISLGENPDFVIWCFPIIGLLILCLIPLLLHQNGFNSFDKATVSGIAGPVIALIAALLTFLAFWAQVQTNKQIYSEPPAKTETEIKTDTTDSSFYELVKIHTGNVVEMDITDKVTGRKVFISMYREFKFCFHALKSVYSLQKELKPGQSILSEQDFMNISYLFFFIGIGNTSDVLIQSLVSHYDKSLIEKYTGYLKKYQKKHNDEGQIFVQAGETLCTLKLKYKPFCGHMPRLEHYYRHLFQTIKFVVEQDEYTTTEKFEYLKILRAQLSGHEQLMLYYYGLTSVGKPWLDNKYFTEYLMLKNLPLPLANFGEQPKDKLGETNSKGEKLFEWDEMNNRKMVFQSGSNNGKPVHLL